MSRCSVAYPFAAAAAAVGGRARSSLTRVAGNDTEFKLLVQIMSAILRDLRFILLTWAKAL